MTLREKLEQSLARCKEVEEELRQQRYRAAENAVRLLELKEALEEEEKKSLELLHNILPEKAMNELREKGSSTPERFENVAVLFGDIVGFTSRSAELEPDVVVRELSEIFTAFDQIFDRHNCERIKTVGDAYLAVSGISARPDCPCLCLLEAADAARAYLLERNRTGAHCWEMRFGMHYGTVVGGIIGIKRFIYDIFGDTVNTASRMETLSEPMRINVSETVKAALPAGAQWHFIDRGRGEVKGKGSMSMFFAEKSN